MVVNFFISVEIPAANIRCVTFSKEAAETIERRAGIKGVFSTFHSLGYQICTDLAGFKPVEPELRYRLMSKLVRKWGLDYKDFDSFISKMRRENLSPKDAAEAGEYEYGACSAYAEYERVRAAEGWMDFDSMLCDAVNLLENPEYRSRYQYEYLIVDEAQDTDNCHPPGTLVWKLNAKRWSRGHRASWIETPVEDLQNGDFVVSWNRRHAQLTYIPQPISIGKRYFSGDLIQVRCRNKMVEVTPDHQFYVTLNGQEHTTYVVYLMYRSDLGFRVGQCAMRYERNTPKKRKSIPGLGTRFAEERAERGWILRVCTSREESMIWEPGLRGHRHFGCGKRITNRAPAGILLTRIVPLCSAMIRLAIARPKPVPRSFVEKCGRKSLSLSEGEIPWPLSEISISTESPLPSSLAWRRANGESPTLPSPRLRCRSERPPRNVPAPARAAQGVPPGHTGRSATTWAIGLASLQRAPPIPDR